MPASPPSCRSKSCCANPKPPAAATSGREEFLRKVWDWKTEKGGTIIEQMKRLGDSCDWERNAFTMSGAPGAPPADATGNFHDAVIKVFVDLYDKGLIYRGKRLVNWDPHFETAISDLEVENIEVPGHMWHFKYPLADGATYSYVEKDDDGTVLFEETRDYISIATTRPETMLGDGAVAVHPSDERYAPIVGHLCEIPVGPKDHRRLIPIITDPYPDPGFGSGAVKITGAHDFNDYAVAKRAGIPCYRLMDSAGRMREDGAPYEEAAGIADRASRAWLVSSGYASQGYAEQPFELTEAEVDALNLVPDHLRGLDRFEARAQVVAEITAEGLAVMTEATDPRLGPADRKRGESHQPLEPEEGGEARDEDAQLVPLVESRPIMQPFGDRSGVVVEPMLTDQWFVDSERIVGPALRAVRDGRTRILPDSGEKTYYHWLENIEPWCISRQLWWGHRIPVWYAPGALSDDDDRWAAICAPTEDEAIAHVRAAHGDDVDIVLVETELEADEILRQDIAAMNPRAEGMIRQAQGPIRIPVWRDPDVLDTWFSSGLWPIGTLGWPEDTAELRKYFPTDVLITGQDILFFWVARMMMMQLAVMGEVPFHTVYLHGLVRDEKGQKMSKTKGNVVDPLDLIDRYGADALRFANASMASLGGVLKFSEDRIKGYRNFGTKLWNACRFAEMNGATTGQLAYDWHTSGARLADSRSTVNRWIVGELARVRAEVDEALEAYRFNDAASALYAFVWGRVCDWYVEFSKPLLLDGTAEEQAETRATMAWVLDNCLIMLHPFMPFITEELWDRLGSRTKMLVHADWPEALGEDLVDPAAEAEMRWAISLIEGVRSARAADERPRRPPRPAGHGRGRRGRPQRIGAQRNSHQAPGPHLDHHRSHPAPRLTRRPAPRRQLRAAPRRHHRRRRRDRARRARAAKGRQGARRPARPAEEPELRRLRPGGGGRGNPRQPRPAGRGRSPAPRRPVPPPGDCVTAGSRPHKPCSAETETPDDRLPRPRRTPNPQGRGRGSVRQPPRRRQAAAAPRRRRRRHRRGGLPDHGRGRRRSRGNRASQGDSRAEGASGRLSPTPPPARLPWPTSPGSSSATPSRWRPAASSCAPDPHLALKYSGGSRLPGRTGAAPPPRLPPRAASA